MKNSIMQFVLYLSLAFNLGFIVMFTYIMVNKPKPMMPHKPHARQHKMRHFFKDEGIKEMRLENLELRKEFFKELAKPEIDYDTINKLVSKLEESQRHLEHSVLQHFIKLREEVSNEEAEDIFTSYIQRYNSRRGGAWGEGRGTRGVGRGRGVRGEG